MALTKEHRGSLPESDFAVPGKRALPMHDETHVRMAWNMLHKTKGLSSEEISHAKERILHKAHSIGIDTKDWHAEASPGQVNADADVNNEDDDLKLSFSGMALNMPEVEDHPNKVPFKGVLTKLDEPSDAPLGGSYGKKVILPKAVAEKALASLLGMAIDFTPDLDGHSVQNKIGLISGAEIVGNEIHIEGFFYAADFPTEVMTIRAKKSQLGFSYEAQAEIRSKSDNPLVITNCVFTGAAVLYKDKAAYTTTSLTAKKSENTMSDNDTNVLEIIKNLQNEVAELKKAQVKDMSIQAGSVHHLVKPHADALRAAAESMKHAGVGMHAKMGHVAVLHHMADHLEAKAGAGEIPHVYQTGDYFMHANADNSAIDSLKKEFADLNASLNTKLDDVKKSNFAAAAEPNRKTLPAGLSKLLEKEGLTASLDKGLTKQDVDIAFGKSTLTNAQKIEAKVNLMMGGRVDANAH